MFPPKVSVCMITYKHESFIAQAIEGVLMQDSGFPIELIIADDASPDKTQEIVESYINNHPRGNWIKYTKHPQNLGMIENFIWALKQCQGKYIAICEGDDFWTNKYKLRKQVKVLEGNNNVNLVFHDVSIRNEITNSDKKLNSRIKLIPGIQNKFDYLSGEFHINTLSTVFRNMLEETLFKNMRKHAVGDFSIWVYLLRNGDFYYLNKNFGTYRVSEIGIWSTKSIDLKIDSYFDYLNDQYFFNASEEIFAYKNYILKAFLELFKRNEELYYKKVKQFEHQFSFEEHLKILNTELLHALQFKSSFFYKVFSFYHRIRKR